MDVGVPGDFGCRFLSFLPAAPQCRRQPLEASLHLEAPGAPAIIPTHRPFNLNLLAPWELKNPIHNPVKLIQQALDHYAARQVAGHDIPLELLQDMLLEDRRPETHTLERLLPRNRLAAVERADHSLLFHSTGEAGDVVSLTLLTKPATNDADQPSGVNSSAEVHARLVAECCVGRTIHQLAAWNPAHTSVNIPCWLAACCMHMIYILKAEPDYGGSSSASWTLSVAAAARCPAPCLHCVWSPSLPEVAAVLSDRHLITVWCADVAPPVWKHPPQAPQAAVGERLAAEASAGIRELEISVVVKAEDAPEFDLAVCCPSCEYGRHPRTVLCAYGSTLILSHIPAPMPPPAITAMLPTPPPTTLCSLPDGEYFFALSRPSSELLSTHLDASSFLSAATTSRLMLIDLRRPHRPLLSWNHRMAQEPPRTCALHLTVITAEDAALAQANRPVPISQGNEVNPASSSQEPPPFSQVNLFTQSQAFQATQASQAFNDQPDHPQPPSFHSTPSPPPPVGSILGLITCVGFLHGEHRCVEFTYVPPGIGLQASTRDANHAGLETPMSQRGKGTKRIYPGAADQTTPPDNRESAAKRAKLAAPATPVELTPMGGATGRVGLNGALDGRPWISVVKLRGEEEDQGEGERGGLQGGVGYGSGGSRQPERRDSDPAGSNMSGDESKAPWVLHQCADVFSPSPVNSLCTPLEACTALPEYERVLQERMRLYVDIASRRRWQISPWEPVFQAEALAELDDIQAVRESAPDCQGSLLLWLPASPHWSTSGRCSASPSSGPLLVRCSVDGDLVLQRCWWFSHLSSCGVQKLKEKVDVRVEVDRAVGTRATPLEIGAYTRVCMRLWKDEWKRHQLVDPKKPLPESNQDPYPHTTALPLHFAHLVRVLLQPNHGVVEVHVAAEVEGQQSGPTLPNQQQAQANQHPLQNIPPEGQQQRKPPAGPAGRGRQKNEKKHRTTVDRAAVQNVLNEWVDPAQVDHLSGGPSTQMPPSLPYHPISEESSVTRASHTLLSTRHWAQAHQPHLLIQPLTLAPEPSAANKQEEKNTRAKQNAVDQPEDQGVGDPVVPPPQLGERGVGESIAAPLWERTAGQWRGFLMRLLTAVRVGKQLENEGEEGSNAGMEEQEPDVLRAKFYGTGMAPWKCPYCKQLVMQSRHGMYSHLKERCQALDKKLKALGSAGSHALSHLGLQLAAEGDIQGAVTLAAVTTPVVEMLREGEQDRPLSCIRAGKRKTGKQKK